MLAFLRAAAARLRSDERGSIAIVTILSAGVIFGTAALSIDASRFYLLKRQQQMATDLAAIAASSSIGSAAAAAQASLAANGRSAGDLASVELGTYVPDPTVAPGLRFTPGAAAGANAARVTLRTSNASFFGSVLSLVSPAGAASLPAPQPSQAGQAGTAVITTRSIATMQNSAAFALGSRLASLDGGLANSLLGPLVGARLSLSVLDYDALASANLDLFGLANALALRVAPNGTTYGTLASMKVRLVDVLLAAADAGTAAGGTPGAAQALRGMASAVGTSGPMLTFGSLVSYSSFGYLAVGSAAPVSAAVPLLPLVTAAAKLGGAASEITGSLTLSVPGVASGSFKIVVGALPTGSSYAAVGPSGTTIHTAQTRVLLTLQVSGAAPIAALNLPFYLELAPATARVAGVTCSAGVPGATPVTLGVSPGVVDAWIGTVSDSDMTNAASKPAPLAAALATVLGLQVTGLAHVTVSNISETLVPFSASDIAAGATKTTTTVDYTSSLLSGLFGSLQLGASAGGFSVGVPPLLSNAVTVSLQNQLQPVDAALSGTLALLGLSVGDADTWVRGVRCGQGMLVN